jgi:hypothetical protein
LNSVKSSIKWRNEPWLFKIDDTIEVRGRCIRLSARTARRNAKFRSSPGKIARCIAGTVFPNTRNAVVKKIIPGREFV